MYTYTYIYYLRLLLPQALSGLWNESQTELRRVLDDNRQMSVKSSGPLCQKEPSVSGTVMKRNTHRPSPNKAQSSYPEFLRALSEDEIDARRRSRAEVAGFLLTNGAFSQRPDRPNIASSRPPPKGVWANYSELEQGHPELLLGIYNIGLDSGFGIIVI